MMKRLCSSLIALSLLATPLLAETSGPTEAGTYAMRPCDSWFYVFDISAYACNFRGPRIEVVTAKGLAELNQKIATLEERLAQLEAMLQQ